jgi:hypothetical protein
MPEAATQPELTPAERYVAAAGVSNTLSKVMEVLYYADDEFAPGVHGNARLGRWGKTLQGDRPSLRRGVS